MNNADFHRSTVPSPGGSETQDSGGITRAFIKVCDADPIFFNEVDAV